MVTELRGFICDSVFVTAAGGVLRDDLGFLRVSSRDVDDEDRNHRDDGSHRHSKNQIPGFESHDRLHPFLAGV